MLIHEIGHLWNGISIKTDERTEWFSEGFTDFVAYKIERKIGLLKQAEWKKLVVKKQNEYQQAKKNNKVTMEEPVMTKGAIMILFIAEGFCLH
ncbi:MAG: hypothetical protein ABR503_16185 [Chitinophagaceae bacterium]